MMILGQLFQVEQVTNVWPSREAAFLVRVVWRRAPSRIVMPSWLEEHSKLRLYKVISESL